MNILITGSQGVIGTVLARTLRTRGHGVFGVDLAHCSDDEYIRLDVRNYRLMDEFFMQNKFDLVYHCAAEFGRHNGDRYFDDLWTTNILGTKNVLAMQEKYGFKMVFFSSSETYGDWPGTMTEDVMVNHEVRQLNDYAMTKWMGEQLCLRSIEDHGSKIVRVRLFNTYGEEPYTPYRSVNVRFAWNAIHGLSSTVYKGHSRTSTYVTDTCTTLANLTSHNFIPGAVYNIGGNRLHSMEELVQLTYKIAGANPELIRYWETEEPRTTKTKVVSCQRAIDDLGHHPTIDLEEGIKMQIDWLRSR